MHDYFASIGPDGARMMRLCCAIQINLDAGTPQQARRRWHLANLMAPILAGMFANSPLAAGSASGWKSTRSHVWHGVDPSRTGILPGGDGPNEYLAFALDAGLLLQREADGYRAGRPSFTFRDWLNGGGDRAPTLDDWHYHLTTLFPQVRARGYLELRSIDALPVRWRPVPVALASALLMDDAACRAATDLLEPHCEQLPELGVIAARSGLEDPTVARLAQSLMGTAQAAFSRLPEGWISSGIAATVTAFDVLYTARSRCPADDILDS
jgi:glutamate--cysteine ligase